MGKKKEIKKPNFLYWHYTNSLRWPMIQESGVIQLATAGIEKNERPAVWLSSNQEWENSASCYGSSSELGTEFATFQNMGLNPIRIGVAVTNNYMNWKSFKKKSGINKEVALGLETTSLGKQSNPKEWRISFKPIPKNKWLAVEEFDGEKWVAIRDEEIQKERVG